MLFSAPSRKTSGRRDDTDGAEDARPRGASGDTRGRVCSPSIICVGCERRVRDAHEATGAKLQLKSGDSYTRKRRGDGAEIFTLKKPRCAE